MSRAPSNTDVEFLRIPHLRGVELRYSCYRESVFRTHTHPVWSVGLVESGSTTFALGGQEHRAGAGTIVVIPPAEAHACNPTQGESITYCMFYLAPEWLALPDPRQGFPNFPDPVIYDAPLFERLLGVYRDFVADPDAADAGALRQAIGALVETYSEPATASMSDREFDCVADAKLLMQRNLTARLTLDEIARAVNMSRSHLSRTFSAVEGLPPHTYRNQLRIERAKELLATDMPLADIALASGFSDQSHFARVFREFTGATPSQYRSGDVGAR